MSSGRNIDSEGTVSMSWLVRALSKVIPLSLLLHGGMALAQSTPVESSLGNDAGTSPAPAIDSVEAGVATPQPTPEQSPVTAPERSPQVSEAEVDAILSDFSGSSDEGAISDIDEPSPVQVYGFADVGYRHLFVKKDNPWLLFLNRHPSIFVGNINVYLDAKLASKWRAMVEVRLTYLPQGAPITDLTTGTIERESTRTSDYTDFTRSKGLGGLIIERAFIEYSPFAFLSLKAGQWLTPYGIWNVDHGSPVIIGVSRPFIIGAELLPEHQVGLMADGSKSFRDDWEANYMLAVSNGRIDFVPYEDLDGNKAVTGRLALTYRKYGQMTLGSSFYVGRHTESVNQLKLDGTDPKSSERIDRQFDEVSYALDYRWVYKSLHVQGEWILNDRRYTKRGRPPGPDGGLRPDKRNKGGYGLIGYRLPWFPLMPYFKAEYSPEPQSQTVGVADQIAIVTGGLNYRPLPNAVLKMEYVYGWFPENDPKSFSSYSIQGLDLQVAWSF